MNIDIFKNIPVKQRASCAVCGKKLSSPLIDLPEFPITEILTPSRPKAPTGFVNQEFHYCRCGHGQLSNIVSPEILYTQAYSYRTSASRAGSSGINVFKDFIDRIIRDRTFETIVEIGCNDLTLLKALKNKGRQLVGIDPILKLLIGEVEDSRFKLIPELFEKVSREAYSLSGPALYLSSHNLEHIENPREMLHKLLSEAHEKSLFIFQFPCLDILTEEGRFDQIFHHHLQYFSFASFRTLVEESGGILIDFDWNRPYWGSLLVAFQKAPLKKSSPVKMSKPVPGIPKPDFVRDQYCLFRESMAALGRTIAVLKNEKKFCYGAVLTLPTIAYHLQNNLSDFEGIVDDDPSKEGMFYLNLSVPIQNAAKVDMKEANVMITALNNARQILPRLILKEPKRIFLPMGHL